MAALSFRQMLGVPASTASPSDSTLLIIDAQNEYAEGQLKVSNVLESRKAIASLLNKYRVGGGKVVHIVHNTPASPGLHARHQAVRGVRGAGAERWRDGNRKTAPELVCRHRAGPGPGGKGKIVLTGYMAHVCVSTTARDAARMGYEVVIAEDAVGDRDIPGASGSEVTKMVMNELGDAFGTIVQSSEIE